MTPAQDLVCRRHIAAVLHVQVFIQQYGGAHLSVFQQQGGVCTERLGALTLELPPLRSRSDEIPSLSSLYLNSLNLELGKQISGFEPRAIEMLRQYPWPNNYTQFKNLLRSLATLTNGPYIRSSSVADLLSKERSLRSAPAAHPAAVVSTDTSRTLESIIGEVVQQTVAAHGGNRAAAARQLGISRTTLWRYLGKIEAGEPTDPT